MKLRIALAAVLYGVALSLGALIVTGHFMSSTFGAGAHQASALEASDEGSMLLLCDGCISRPGATVTVTITVGVAPGYNSGCCYQPVYVPQPVYHYQPQPIYYYQPQPIIYHNPCSWGCGYGGYNWGGGCNGVLCIDHWGGPGYGGYNQWGGGCNCWNNWNYGWNGHWNRNVHVHGHNH